MWREEKLDVDEIGCGFWILSPHYALRINSCVRIMHNYFKYVIKLVN